LSPVGARRGGERRRYEPGAFCRLGLATSDPAGARAFYAGLFGWESHDLPAGELGAYTVLRHDGRELAILYRQTREARAARAAPHWTPYVSVEDADASALRALELGGTLLREPHDVADAGRVAAVRDPVGGILSLWQPRAHDAAELVTDMGAMCWHELAGTDLDRAKSFYGELLGWRFEADPSGDTTITNAGSPIATMREPSKPRPPVGWIPYFGVANADDAQQSAEQTGGRTLTAPADGPIGRTALLADPQGATFALLEQPRRA
jgi:predicted enzyme related to lactoylglutathione lyase